MSKEKLYSIPVNDAFSADCECPICQMYATLEKNAVEYTMSSSYMEDDTRAKTDAAGFCAHHIKMVYNENNRLGMAWVMKTHFDKTINDVHKKLPSGPAKMLKKDMSEADVIKYLDTLNSSCFVCDRINDFYGRYLETVIDMWKKDPSFKEKFMNCKGFCSEHYTVLLKLAAKTLKGDELTEFIAVTNELYITNMERVRDDLAWFINKFDYKYQDEPWKNAKDSLQRSMTKADSIIIS